MKTSEGGCRCKNVRYEIEGDALHVSICHCEDCRRSAGAPYVAWAGVKSESFRLLKGKPKMWTIDEQSLRFFCGDCGTGLYHRNETKMPGLVDVQVATLDNPEDWPPQLQVQIAEKLQWIDESVHMPEYQRYPDFPIPKKPH